MLEKFFADFGLPTSEEFEKLFAVFGLTSSAAAGAAAADATSAVCIYYDIVLIRGREAPPP